MRTGLLMMTAAFALMAASANLGSAFAQRAGDANFDSARYASADTANIPQPHLQKALALAAEHPTFFYPALLNCYPQNKEATGEMMGNPPPQKVFDNMYNLGKGPGRGDTAWAITTSAGIILIDALDNADLAKNQIVGGLKNLGLDPADIKDVIITHGHADHYGGARYLQDNFPGLHVYMSAVDYDLAEKSAANPRPGAKSPPAPAPKRDQIVTDGQKITLGDETVTLYITPGHTPGTLSLIFPVKDHGATHTISFWGGTNSDSLDLHWGQEYAQSIARFIKLTQAAGSDGYMSNHLPLDGSALNLAKIRTAPTAPNPYFVGNAATVNFYRQIEECNLNELDIHKAQGRK